MILKKMNKEYFNYSIRLLSRKDYSRFKIKEKIISKFPEALFTEVEELLDSLVEKKYLREDCYTEARVKGLMHKNYSPEYIKNKLKSENVEIGLDKVYSIFDEHNFNEEKQIKKLISKKIAFKEITPESREKMKSKIFRFLTSKGHCANTSLRLINLELYKS